MPAIIKRIDSKVELSTINRFPTKISNIESRSDFFRPKCSVKEVKVRKQRIEEMKTRVEKKTKVDLYSQRKSAEENELANEMNGYSGIYNLLS